MGAFVANDDSPEEGRVAVAIGRFEVGALRMRRERNCDVFDQDLGDVHGGNGIAKTHRRHERSKPVGIGLVDKVVDGGYVSSLLIDKVEGCLLGGQNRFVEKRPLASDVCGRSWGVEILAVIFLHQNEPVGVGEAERGSDVGWRRLNRVDDADFSFRFGMRNGGLGEGVEYGGDDGRGGGEDGVRWEVVLGGVIVMVIVMVFPFMSTILLILRMGIAFIRRLMRIWEWIVGIGCDLGVCVGGVIIGRRVIGMVVGFTVTVSTVLDIAKIFLPVASYIVPLLGLTLLSNVCCTYAIDCNSEPITNCIQPILHIKAMKVIVETSIAFLIRFFLPKSLTFSSAFILVSFTSALYFLLCSFFTNFSSSLIFTF